MKQINVYTKVCLPCVDKKEWREFQRLVWDAGYEINVVRTTYDKALHQEATELWGSENYIAFVLAPNGEALNLGKAKKMFEGINNKLVEAGKTKPVRKGNKNVQRLRKAKRSIRISAVENTPGEVKVQTKARQKVFVKGAGK